MASGVCIILYLLRFVEAMKRGQENEGNFFAEE